MQTISTWEALDERLSATNLNQSKLVAPSGSLCWLHQR